MSREFPTAVVLTIATGRFVCDDLSNLQDCTEYLVGEPVWTHQLPRVWGEVAPWLIARHEECRRAESNVPALDGLLIAMKNPKRACRQWLKKLDLPETLTVEPIPKDDHTSIDPLEELQAMKPDAEVIVIRE